MDNVSLLGGEVFRPWNNNVVQTKTKGYMLKEGEQRRITIHGMVRKAYG